MSLEMSERSAIADGWMRADPLWAIIAATGQPLRTVMAVVREMGLPERDPCTCEPIGGTVVMGEVSIAGAAVHGAGAQSAPGAPRQQPQWASEGPRGDAPS